MADPVTLAEAKLWAKVDETDDDALITALITAATDWCEMFCRRTFVTTTLTESVTSFDEMELPLPPLVSITSIVYTDTGGTTATVSSSIYTTDTTVEPGELILDYGQSWPADSRGDQNGITVTYVGGYGAASAVPEAIKTAIKMLVAHWYEHRTAVTDLSRVQEVPMAVKALLWAYRVQVA